MTSDPLLTIHALRDRETDRVAHESRSRAARVDALQVDRSFVAKVPIWPWSPEQAKYEPALIVIRAQATEQDKLDAWRGIVGR